MMYFVLEMRRDSGIQKGRQGGGGVIQSKDETEDEEPAGKTKIARQRKRSRHSNKQRKGERERDNMGDREKRIKETDRERNKEKGQLYVHIVQCTHMIGMEGKYFFYIMYFGLQEAKPPQYILYCTM
jgi:hypothetical protein